MGLFSSSWCQMMDAASRKLCKTDNNKDALSCGKWLCHESCWKASIKAIENGRPVDVTCIGGINLYAVPILANGEVIGAINFGHGNPPDDESELQRLSDLYQIPIEKMRKARRDYQVRPQFIIDHAKKRIQVSAKHIGNLVERKQAEENLKQIHLEVQELNETLEKKVVQRTERINQLLEQKDEFINQLGHDLKNPLGPFLQLLPVLENHVDDDKDKQLVKVLNRNAKYMRNLVKKTIDLAKLNSSKTKFSFEDVSLSDIIDEVVAANSSLFDNHDVVVDNKVSSDCLVHADALHIEEVFTNLFNNAVKYSEDKRWISIDAVEKDDFVVVSIRDKGVGISDEQLPFLFDEYYKADASRHDFDSSGLGLPICKRIVEKHGGRIWAESPGIGKGSTFYFTLPKVIT
jgi:signal transduction histidine kinase